MDIHRFLEKNQIAIYVEYSSVEKSYKIFKNNLATLSYYSLFDRIVLHSDYEYLESVRNEPQLPVIWSQGSTKCCVFPLSSSKIICLFFEFESDGVRISSRCKEYMRYLQQ